MSKHLLSFLLSELKTVRILCQNEACRAILEMPISEVARFVSGGQCPFCQRQFRVVNENTLVTLAEAIKNLQSIKDKVQVEFVLPVEE